MDSGDDDYESQPLPYLRCISTAPPPLPPPPFDPLSNYLHLHNPNTPVIFQSPTADRVAAARNPRKRSRASRRAPTTVLTTDTSNFRAMVQEFTGIPSPPFSKSSSLSRRRLDHFTGASETAPYLIRRPFAESPAPFVVSSTASSMSSSSSINCQLPNLFNVQNPNSLTSLLQFSRPKFLLSSFNDQDLLTSDHFDERFGLKNHENHDHHVSTALINGLPNLVSTDQVGAEKDPSKSKTTTTTSISGGCYSFSPTSGFRGGKGPENMAPSGEGMVDSWICSSD